MYGLGLLGLLGTQIAAAGGIYTVGLDLDPRRRDDARRASGRSRRRIRPMRPRSRALVLELTDGFGADGVVLGVVTTSDRPMNHAFELCRQKGVVVGLGAFGTKIERDTMVWNDVTLVMQLGVRPGSVRPGLRGGQRRLPDRLRPLDREPQRPALPAARWRRARSSRSRSNRSGSRSPMRRPPTSASRRPTGRRRCCSSIRNDASRSPATRYHVSCRPCP